jgi:hypothetical protein
MTRKKVQLNVAEGGGTREARVGRLVKLQSHGVLFWVRVIEVISEGYFRGTVHDAMPAEHLLRAGDKIKFKSRHVYEVV